MATVAQITANKMNALKSTGPKTLAGMRRSSQNAVKWGLFSRHVVLTEQDAEDWQQLAPRIRAILQPVGEIEEFLSDEVIANWFRLARCLKIDGGLFTAYSNYQGRPCGIGTAFAQTAQMDIFGKLNRYEQHLERKLSLSLQRYQSTRRSRAEAAQPPPQLLSPATTSTSSASSLLNPPAVMRSISAEARNPTWRFIVAKVITWWRTPEHRSEVSGAKTRIEQCTSCRL